MPGSFVYPPRVDLAHTPTPLEPTARLSAKPGVDLWVKRDDLTGCALTGNKVRKLEFLFAEALGGGANVVVTCGGEQSNHCRATALAAARLGLRCVLLLRRVDPTHRPLVEANILLDCLAGAEIRWVSYAEYRHRQELMAALAEELRQRGEVPYLIPEGGSNARGAFGYVRAVEELASQMGPQLCSWPGGEKVTLVYAAGSGGTGAGLQLGVRLFGLPIRPVGFCVCDDRDYFVRTISTICEQACAEFALPVRVPPEEIEIVDGYVGRGYALSHPDELALLRDVARSSGLVLDPVYTGKAFFGLCSELRRNPEQFGKRIIFLHSGGIFGLFPKASEIAPLL